MQLMKFTSSLTGSILCVTHVRQPFLYSNFKDATQRKTVTICGSHAVGRLTVA